MFGLSNGVLGLLNFFILFVSIPILILAAVVQIHGVTECDKFLRFPLFALGIYIFIISFLGLIGSCCQATSLIKLYLGIIVLSLIGAFGFTIYSGVMIHDSAGMDDFVKNNDYRLDKISSRMKGFVMNDKNWATIKSCMIESNFCAELVNYNPMDAQTLELVMPPIQGGCCKPPDHCEFEFKNTTFWAVPESGLQSEDPECRKWSNKFDTKCFNCNTCKAGFLGNSNDYWKEILDYTIFFIIVFIFISVIGRCALKNSQTPRPTKYKVYDV